MTTLLDCQDVRKSFGAVQALSGASLSVEGETVHGLVGHNGAGKSTLVRTIAGLVKCDRGTLTFDGRPLGELTRRQTIQCGIWSVPQEMTLLPGLTVADNICAGDEPRVGPMVSRRQMRRRVTETLERLELHDLSPDDEIDGLLPSEKRMVMIAMAVSRQCRLLILDEPTASLGVSEADRVLDFVKGLPTRGITVLYISHRLDEMERICDRVTVMRDGRTRGTYDRGDFNARMLIKEMVGEVVEPQVVSPLDVPRHQSLLTVRGVHGKSLRGIDIDIRAGTITGVTGIIGSGADELLAVIAGVVQPTNGTLSLSGEEVGFRRPADALRAGIGYIAGTRESAALVDLTVRENVLMSSYETVGRAGLLVGQRERRRAEEFVAGFGLQSRIDDPLRELSGGNQQKVLIARLLAADVKLIVVNDPTAGVDVRARADIHALLRSAAREGRAVLVRCSEPEELIDLADEICVLAGGRVARSFVGGSIEISALLEASATS